MNAFELQALEPVHTVLLVDDEPRILQALRRLFRSTSHRVLTATGGEEGLALLSTESVDIVVSDMRMPEMDGAEFLERVRRRFPLTARVLLTGHAELDSTIAAINRGEIHRYITKPWDDAELLTTIDQVLDRRALEERNRRLEELTFAQNATLARLNGQLELQVARQTQALADNVAALQRANQRLEQGLVNSVRVFSSLLGLQDAGAAAHCGRVAALARDMAVRVRLGPAGIRNAYLAGLLHELGKVGLPPRTHVVGAPASSQWPQSSGPHAYPARGANLLMAIDELADVATIVRRQHERCEGSSDSHAAAGSLPMEARILAVANDFDELRFVAPVGPAQIDPTAAVAMLGRRRDRDYDPTAMRALADCVALAAGASPLPPCLRGNADADCDGDADADAKFLRLSSQALMPGMILAEDVFSEEGVLMAAADHEFDARSIAQLREFDRLNPEPLSLCIRSLGAAL